MANPLAAKSWSPYWVGAGVGVLSWFAFASANQPLGITTAFEDTAALGHQAVVPSAEARNPLYRAREQGGELPQIGWEWMLVLGVLFGAIISSRLSGDRSVQRVPPLWRWRFGPSAALRFSAAFLGGAVMMLGARLAKGCTSGHGISGTLQLALSSWVFILAAFAVAVGVALLMYGREGRQPCLLNPES